MKKLEKIKYALDTIKDKFGVALNNNEIRYKERVGDITIYFDCDSKLIGIEVDNVSDHVEDLVISIAKVGFNKIFNNNSKQINERNFNTLIEKINDLKEINK